MITDMDAAVTAGEPDAASPLARRDRLVAVTVRLDPDHYERLKLYGLKRRLTNQQILVRALDLFLSQT
jgi:hypothetical protein